LDDGLGSSAHSVTTKNTITAETVVAKNEHYNEDTTLDHGR